MIEDLLVTFRSAIIDRKQKKAISILSTIRSSESYTLQTINESQCTDEFKISSHLWTKAGKWYRQYGSCGDIGDEIIYEESHKKVDSARTHIHIYFTVTYFQKFKNYFNLLHNQLYKVCGHVRFSCLAKSSTSMGLWSSAACRQQCSLIPYQHVHTYVLLVCYKACRPQTLSRICTRIRVCVLHIHQIS